MARLDLDIDGTDNTVYMTESYAEPMGPDNPYGLSLVTRNVALRTESEGKQDFNFATQRSWKVVNTNVVNGLGTHPSYKLVPGRGDSGDVRPGVADVPARHRHRPHPVGDPQPSR